MPVTRQPAPAASAGGPGKRNPPVNQTGQDTVAGKAIRTRSAKEPTSLDNIGEITAARPLAITAGAVFGAALGLLRFRLGPPCSGFLSSNGCEPVPNAQEIYMAGMLDAMGEFRNYHPLHTYRELVRRETCITKTKVTAAQLVQGMTSYAKLNPAAFSTGIAGMGRTFSSPTGLSTYLGFICPDLFNKAAYDRDDAVMARYPVDPEDAR